MSPDLTTISHDLRTPLNAIRTWAQILGTKLGESDDPVIQRALDGILKGIDDQVRLLDELSRPR